MRLRALAPSHTDSPKPIVNVMVKIHAARGPVIRNVFAKIAASRKLPQTECCDVNGTYDTLNYLGRMSVQAFLKLPERVHMCFAVKRNGEQSIRRNHRCSFNDRFPHIAKVVQNPPKNTRCQTSLRAPDQD